MGNKIIDLFCGCGGLSKGFEDAGFEVALAIDFWDDAIFTFNKNHKNNVGKSIDIHNLTNENLDTYKEKGVIGIIGGPPCQGFSTVGKREINDPRNSLYLEYCRVVERVQPEFFVLENVKGLLTLDDGAFKDDIINHFSKLGYTVKYKVLNAADFGVPQNRQRVFFVGIKNREFIFPEPLKKQVSSKEAISDLDFINELNGANDSFEYPDIELTNYQRLMRANSKRIYNHQITNHSKQTKNIINMIPDGGKIKDLPKEYWTIRKYNKAFERMNSSKPSNTVDTGHRNYFHYCKPRIPTVRENCRLQSFPDDFIIYGSRTSQYKQVGNAVPPLLSKAIALNIKKQIKD